MIPPYVFIGFTGFIIFMLLRDYWVHKVRLAHHGLVADFMSEKIDDRTYTSELQIQYHECIWSYHKILLYFWIWDLRKMVTDQLKFDALMEFKKERNKNG